MTGPKQIKARLEIAKNQLSYLRGKTTTSKARFTYVNNSLDDIADLLAENERLGAENEAMRAVVEAAKALSAFWLNQPDNLSVLEVFAKFRFFDLLTELMELFPRKELSALDNLAGAK